MNYMENGVWIADFCPICMCKVIPSTVFNEIQKALVEEGLEKALKIIYKVPEVARLDILLPRRKSGTLENRPVIYPLCRNCSKMPRTKQFKDSIEDNLAQNKHRLQLVEGFNIKTWALKPRESRCVF